MNATFYLLPLSAAGLVERFAAFASEAFPTAPIRAFEVNTPLGGFSLVEKNKATGQNLLEHPPYVEKRAVLARHPYLDTTSLTLMLGHPQGDQSLVWYPSETPPNLKLNLAESLPMPDRLQITEILHKHFHLLRKDELLSARVDPTQLPIAKFAETAVQNLAAQGAKLAQLSAEKLTEFNQVLIDKTAALEKLYQDKEAALAKAYNDKEVTLNERIHAQQAKEAAFDLRENTVVRRAIFENLSKIIDDQREIKISDETLKKRWVIHGVCGILGVLGIGLISVGAYKFLNASTIDWHLLLPISGGLLLTGSTAVFYLRWADQWFRDYAEAEFANRKFKADMSRAAWLVEMFFEWEQKKVTSVPHEIIGRLAANLFSTEHRGGTRHPFDDFTAIAKEASKFKIGKTGIEFEREPKTNS